MTEGQRATLIENDVDALDALGSLMDREKNERDNPLLFLSDEFLKGGSLTAEVFASEDKEKYEEGTDSGKFDGYRYRGSDFPIRSDELPNRTILEFSRWREQVE